MYGVFMLMTIFGQLNEQIMPQFVAQRALYEVRERASKMYSWQGVLILMLGPSTFCLLSSQLLYSAIF